MIDIKVDRYMFDNKLKDNPKAREKQILAFGYLDGFLEENLYKQYIDNEDKNYYLGYKEGVLKREEVGNINSYKDEWIIKLASYDAKHNIEREGFSSLAEKVYNLYYSDAIYNEEDLPINFFEESLESGYGEFDKDSPWGFTFYDEETLKNKKNI